MTHLSSLRYKTLELIPDDELAVKRRAEKLFKELEVINQDNVAALIPIRSIDLHPRQLCLSDLVFGEDYEVGSTYLDGEFATYDAISEAIKDQETTISDLEDEVTAANETIAELEAKIEQIEKDIDTDMPAAEDNRLQNKLLRLQKRLAKAEKARDEGESKVSTAEDRLKELEDGRDEPDYDEIMWNTVWRPEGDDVDADIAHRIPNLGVVTLLNEDNDSYIGLTGCGMDLSPCVMAYTVLAFEAIDPEYVRYFTRDQDIHYALNVIGKSLLLECAAVLKIQPAFDHKLAEMDRKAKAARRAEEKKLAAQKRRRQKKPDARLLKLAWAALDAYEKTPPDQQGRTPTLWELRYDLQDQMVGKPIKELKTIGRLINLLDSYGNISDIYLKDFVHFGKKPTVT